MIGESFKLILERSDQQESNFLLAVVLLSEAQEGMKRNDFEDKIAGLLELDPDSRAVYNKSNAPRYYGFIDAIARNGTEYLLLTPRGRYLLPMIEPVVSKEFKKPQYHIRQSFQSTFLTILLDSMYFDSFGRNNSGVKSSASDVNPPNVMLRLIHDFGKVTDQEILFGVYALHRKEVSSFSNLEKLIQQNREQNKFTYDEISKWKLDSGLSDFKLANLFVDFHLLKMEKEADINWYSFNDDLNAKQKGRIADLPLYYRPKHLVVSESDIDDPLRWSAVCPMGAVGDTDRVITIDCREPDQVKKFDDGFAHALAKAFTPLVLPQVNLPRDTFLVLKGADEGRLQELMGGYGPLLDRINDPTDDFNGWSITSVPFKTAYDLILKEGAKYKCPNGQNPKDVLPKGEVRIPANLHFICEVVK